MCKQISLLQLKVLHIKACRSGVVVQALLRSCLTLHVKHGPSLCQFRAAECTWQPKSWVVTIPDIHGLSPKGTDVSRVHGEKMWEQTGSQPQCLITPIEKILQENNLHFQPLSSAYHL